MFQKYYSINDLENHLSEIIPTLHKNGMVMLCDFANEEQGITIANYFGNIMQTLDALNNGITKITESASGQNANNSRAFTRLDLYPHTDRSPLEHPPELLLNWVLEPSLKGGETILVDGELVYQQMFATNPEETTLLFEDIATFTDGINTYVGGIFSKNANNKIEIRFRNDNCVIFNKRAKNAIKHLISIIDQNRIQIPLQKGKGYLIDNRRWLHGRSSYEGHRVICRAHIQKI